VGAGCGEGIRAPPCEESEELIEHEVAGDAPQSTLLEAGPSGGSTCMVLILNDVARQEGAGVDEDQGFSP
jgi:hypothetical protein